MDIGQKVEGRIVLYVETDQVVIAIQGFPMKEITTVFPVVFLAVNCTEEHAGRLQIQLWYTHFRILEH
jgi:hypothetical protein